MYWPDCRHKRPSGQLPQLRWNPAASQQPSVTAWAGLILWLMLSLPALRAPLESDMTLHMLVQLPLLVLAGMLMTTGLAKQVRTGLHPWNHAGISGLLLASVVMAAWMLPSALDQALDQPLMTAAKFLSLPLLLGMPLALSWPHAGFLVRGMFLVEWIATLFRTGWLYVVSPTRLCLSYRLDEQQVTGEWLLAAGVLILALAAGRLLWGPAIKSAVHSRLASPAHPES